MEYALRKYSQIAIILSDVLDYDTVKHLINMLKKDEIEDSRRYNIERFNCRNFLLQTCPPIMILSRYRFRLTLFLVFFFLDFFFLDFFFLDFFFLDFFFLEPREVGGMIEY